MAVSKAKKLLDDLRRAVGRLQEALEAEPTQLNKDATIQRFEFTFELAWKLMQAVVEAEAIEAFGPKNAIRRAAQVGLVNDPEEWFKFLKARNLTTHVYDQGTADMIYEQAKRFPETIEALMGKAEEALV